MPAISINGVVREDSILQLTLPSLVLNAGSSSIKFQAPFGFTATAADHRLLSYHRPTIHFAPRTVSQTAINSIVSTTPASSRAIESRSPSSSR